MPVPLSLDHVVSELTASQDTAGRFEPLQAKRTATLPEVCANTFVEVVPMQTGSGQPFALEYQVPAGAPGAPQAGVGFPL